MTDKQGEKRPWVEPELIVIVRGSPQESVLAGCKDASGSGAYVAAAACRSTGGNCFLDVAS